MKRPNIPLADLVRAWAPGAVRVLVVPVGGSPTPLVHAYDAHDLPIPLRDGKNAQVATVLREHHAGADWTVAQTWTASDGLQPTRQRLEVAA